MTNLHELADLLQQHIDHSIPAAVKLRIFGRSRYRGLRLFLENQLCQAALALCRSTPASFLARPTALQA